MTAAGWAGHAEDVHVPMRIVVAPSAGVFRAHPAAAAPGAPVRVGQVVGMVEHTAGRVDVPSPHAGDLAGFLVHPGERVRHGQPVAWVRLGPSEYGAPVAAPRPPILTTSPSTSRSVEEATQPGETG